MNCDTTNGPCACGAWHGKKHDGGPVHPMQIKDKGVYVMQPGLTIRDWFAGLAMQSYGLIDISYEKAAEMAYKQADAMLAEGAK